MNLVVAQKKKKDSSTLTYAKKHLCSTGHIYVQALRQCVCVRERERERENAKSEFVTFFFSFENKVRQLKVSSRKKREAQ